MSDLPKRDLRKSDLPKPGAPEMYVSTSIFAGVRFKDEEATRLHLERLRKRAAQRRAREERDAPRTVCA